MHNLFYLEDELMYFFSCDLTVEFFVFSSSIENYRSDKHGFDAMAALSSLGNFMTVFFGAFALGCGMGCVTALVILDLYVELILMCTMLLRADAWEIDQAFSA